MKRRFQDHVTPALIANLAILVLGHLPTAGAAMSQAGRIDERVDFQTEIRPLLSRTCFECHGPDEESRRARLRLDRRVGLLGEQGVGGVVIPGDPEGSELFRRITAEDPDDLMPPPESGHALTSEQIAAIRAWISEGAVWEEHWAFLAPDPRPRTTIARSDVNLEQHDQSVDPIDPIDRLIQAKSRADGLNSSPPADRETLLRRVTFDLTGLPPTRSEMDAFLADESPEAYEAVVDRLLASPAFGERMATAWLDLARFADTHGYQSDVDRPMWAYRDWVIKAFNENLAYDDFVTWQLAGDLLPEPTSDQRLATAFNRLHRQTNEGGSVEEEFRVEYVADRVHTFGTTFLGLTTECARCHSHKFDPISHEEYYELFAFFDDIDESGLYSHFTGAVPTPTLLLTTAETDQRINGLRSRIAEAEAVLEEMESAESPAFDAWIEEAPWTRPEAILVPGLVGEYPLDGIAGGQLENLVDSTKPGGVSGTPIQVPGTDATAIRLDGENNLHFPGVGEFTRVDPFTIALWVKLEAITDRAVVLHRSRAWTDAGSQGYQFLLEDGRVSWSLIHFWPGDALGIRAMEPLPVGEWVEVVLSYDGSSRASGLAIHLDGASISTEIVRDHLTKAITGGGPGAMTIGQRFRDRGFKGGEVDHLRVFNRRLTPIEIRHLHDGEALLDSEPDAAELRAYFNGTVDPAQRMARADLQGLRRELAGVIDGTSEIMVMAELAEPRESRVLERGRYDRPMQVVQPGTPDGIRAFPEGLPPNRLGLAAWVTDPEHPLTARVAVNRLWSIAFGQGIVATPEDFGSQGTRPSHPELLDRLAVDFIQSGWDVKAMLGRLVRSSTYRQASAGTPESRVVDPENRLLSHGPSDRLTAEMVRDQALAASGLLVRTVGGPSVYPYQPGGLWQEKSGRVYPQGTGDALHRRSMYTFWKRTSPPPSMMLFDAAKRDVCVARRSSTSTPLQALVLLNDIQFVEAARVLAEQVIEASPTDHGAQIELAFRLLTGRRPTNPEREILEGLHAEELETFEADPEAAKAVASSGEPPRREELDPARTAAMTVICSTIMNTDAAVMKR